MYSYIKNQQELLEQLKQQIGLLNRSANLFDKGYEDEALKMAVSIRVIVHDGKWPSVLTHLGRKNCKFYDSSLPYNPLSNPSYFGLLRMRMSTKDGVGYYAPLDNIDNPRNKNKKLDFDNWWKNVVIKDKNGNEFSRKDMILEVADKDGGAHIDDELKKEYANLSRSNISGFKVRLNGKLVDFNNRPVLPSIRQITFELLKTLKDEFPMLFKEIHIRRKPCLTLKSASR